MIQDFALLFGYILALVMFVMTFFSSRKSSRLEAMLQDAAKRFNIGKDAYKKLQTEYTAVLEREAKERLVAQTVEAALRETRDELALVTKELERQQDDTQGDVKALRLRLSHLEEEAHVLTEQLKETTSEKLAAVAALQTRTKSDASRLESQVKDLSRTYEELRQRYLTVNNENEKLKSTLEKVDPIAVRKTRRRANRMEQLYVGMKGLREMAEERNQNWETALRYLSSYILQRPMGVDDAKAIGPLVGEALERIGATLIPPGEDKATEPHEP